MGIFTKLFGTRSEREIKKIRGLADRIVELEPEYKALSDEALQGKTEQFRERLRNGETLDELLPEAYATVREAASRVIGQRHYYVQLLGGIILHQGRIAEMRTGEGKTLAATLPSYLNALTGEGVHVVTVNDYLARRDSEWMGKIHRFLGLSVGLIVHGLNNEERRAAYACDITYATNNELGFDYLRDNMVLYKKDLVQRGHDFAIVDEVDSILIDEARTPLIISGRGDESTDLYRQADDFVSRLRGKICATTDEKAPEDENLDADYIVDEKAKTATLTSRGVQKAEQAFGLENLSDLENSTLSHHINQALKARAVMKRDVDYVVQDGQVIIVDSFTGRLMQGRRFSEGLHQAIEAKERVNVQRENKTVATITFQNFFRLYRKLSGMTGTALTEEEEFNAIYGLDAVEIPTNRPNARVDHPDAVYMNEAGKNRAILAKIEECHRNGQPILVGTVSVEKSEYLSSLLKKKGIAHNVLNAKQHAREAEIVAQAGKLGTVTISTNMAGRGTDISLGGNAEFLAKADLRREGLDDAMIDAATGFAATADEEILQARTLYAERLAVHKAEVAKEAELVRAAGGLFILGTERHESRRIDNQLRGRSGRQGDPGESWFVIAMSDDIMRLFGGERIRNMMMAMKLDEDTPIDQKILSGALESAQRRVESMHFQSRKTVLEYDDVMNKQRGIIYEQRRRVLDGEDIHPRILSMVYDTIETGIRGGFARSGKLESREELNAILEPFTKLFLRTEALELPEKTENITPEDLIDAVKQQALAVYEQREKEFGTLPGADAPLMRELERVVLLRVVDEFWMDHIDAMHELRKGIGLRAYGNTRPIDAYKQEGFEMFEAMIAGISEEVSRRIYTVRVRREQPIQRKSAVKIAPQNPGGEKARPVTAAKKPGPNDPCPCGKLRPNGLPMKYKDCCGRRGNKA